MCDCIETMEIRLQTETGDKEAFIDAPLDLDRKIRCFNAKGCYRGKFRGTFQNNLLIVHIPFTCCPWCGKKYKESTNE